jgi:hypothetical protein
MGHVPLGPTSRPWRQVVAMIDERAPVEGIASPVAWTR